MQASTRHLQTPANESSGKIARTRQMRSHGKFEQPTSITEKSQRVNTAEKARIRSSNVVVPQHELNPLDHQIPMKKEKELQGSLRRLRPNENKLMYATAKQQDAVAAKNQKILINYKETAAKEVNPYKMSSSEAEKVKDRNR